MGGILLLIVGLVGAGAGLALVARSVDRLRRSGAFGGLFWSSFREYGAYRVRALRPALQLSLGFCLLGGGLVALYFGLSLFYAGRLGTFSA